MDIWRDPEGRPRALHERGRAAKLSPHQAEIIKRAMIVRSGGGGNGRPPRPAGEPQAPGVEPEAAAIQGVTRALEKVKGSGAGSRR